MSKYELILKNKTDNASSPSSSDRGASESSSWKDTETYKAAKMVSDKIADVSLLRASVSTGKDIVLREYANSDTTDRVNAVLGYVESAVGLGLAYALNPAMGIAQTVSMGLSYVNKISQYNFNQRWERIELQEKRTELGPSYNRSRYGR